ncbi:hypothetical protein IFU39_19100 [Paenibacillus sp. CFBP 13594]|uniref:hypothetical protein n=1 Tax=Paenibacillus sp. CFBP 13594 TaxID=2774037 RepID=UPI001781E9E6|nr:hypothetical protein [Paenibacillus sp. CFBP 13594]MBD8839925.1 hypothetical protein [Paenibacillus sp. CFBP 13594]
MFNKDFLYIGADTAISSRLNGVSYRLHNKGEKIHHIDDMIIFSSGDADLSKIIIDEFKNKESRDVNTLKETIKYWFERYYLKRPGVKEIVDSGKIVNMTVVAKFENGSPVLYELDQRSEFEIKKIKAHDKVAYYNAGVNCKYDNEFFIDQTEKANDVLEAYRNTYANASSEKIGGNLELFVLAKQGIRKILDEKIEEKPFQWYPGDRGAYDNTENIKKMIVAHAQIEGSSLTLRDGTGVFKIFPRIGMWAGSENFHDSPFSVDLFGNLVAHKGKFIGPAGDVLIDTEAGYMDMDKLDIINVGKLVAEMLEVNTILADDGYINNLTVNRLKTIGKDADVGQFIDYIDIQDNYQRWITAQVQSKEQAKDSRDRLLFWQDSEKRILTTEDTGIIAYSYKLTNEKIKREISFDGSGDAAQPTDIIGTGDGGADNRAKMVMTKTNGSYKQEYKASNNGRVRSIDFMDDGIDMNSENGRIFITAKQLTTMADGGPVKIGNTNGYIEITADGTFEFHGKAFNFHTN